MTTTGATHVTVQPTERRRIETIQVFSDGRVRVCRKAPVNNYKVRWYYNASVHSVERLGRSFSPKVRISVNYPLEREAQAQRDEDERNYQAGFKGTW